ncbi:MAG TPA: helix-turn-helix transcriptional regulator [Thermomicrobiaceae bacterium]|nr:helix-turn-helix transcriptional regulator [Thermomicrobiaceae bacterium]
MDELRFSDLLGIFRRRADLSQTALANLIGVIPSYMSRLESGEREPDRDVVIMIGHVLGLHRLDRAALLLSAGYAPDDPAMRAVLRILIEAAVEREHVAA